jgi:magnesium chelatase family protein
MAIALRSRAMIGTVQSCSLLGIDAYAVVVEVVVSSGGLPTYHVVGLPAASVREGSVRIRSALERAGHPLPRKKITVNLAPADRRKDGGAFDLPIALAVLVAEEIIPCESLDGMLLLGELGLDGSLRPVRGALAAGLLAKHRGMKGVILPAESAPEAAEVDGVEVFGARDLGEVIAALRSGSKLAGPAVRERPSAPDWGQVDMSDVRGQETVRLALEIAVAGGHNLLMVGAPGIGKTMLARRIPTILPPLLRDEALETTKVYSAVGLAPHGLIHERPFRAPHHTITTAALVGGGSPPRPGEVSLAHNGVLFLDELPEFARPSIESLRQPLEDRLVAINRATGSIRLPASFLLAASANPCPCGWLGSAQKVCTCSGGAVERYRHKLSGPLLDRIDLQVFVPELSIGQLRTAEPGESSDRMRERVVRAREIQRRRLEPHGARLNAAMSPRGMRATCQLTDRAERELEKLCRIRVSLTGRGVDRLIKVARTIADLDGADVIDADAIREAASYRALDGLSLVHAALARAMGPSQRHAAAETGTA